MKHIKQFNENSNYMSIIEQMKNLKHRHYYWVLFEGYSEPNPCFFIKSEDPDESCFLPGGLGDTSSMGVYAQDIEKIGSEIPIPSI